MEGVGVVGRGGREGILPRTAVMAVCLSVCLLRVHVFLRWHYLPCLLCPSPVLSQSRRVLVLLDTCVPVPLCPIPCVCEFHCVPVPWYAGQSPAEYQSLCVPVPLCPSTCVCDFHCVPVPRYVDLSPAEYQSLCVPVPFCPSPCVYEFHYVPVPLYPGQSPAEYQSLFVPVRVCATSTVSQFLGMQT